MNLRSFVRSSSKRLFIFPVLLVGLGLMFAGRAAAQTFTSLYNFTSNSWGHIGSYTNAEGYNPFAGLILSGSTLYGTANGGAGNGTVFKINKDGSGFTNLYNFTATFGSNNTNSDGAGPNLGLVLLGNTLYGTTSYGGSAGAGTVFAVNTDGSAFTNLHTFIYDDIDGAVPLAGLTQSGNTLYGTTASGGGSGMGTVFKFNSDGTGFTNFYNFTGVDAWIPQARLIISGNTLYGTSSLGGSSTRGNVFAVNTDGSGFTNLHSFSTTLPQSYSTSGTNNDGATPRTELILFGNTLYGTASRGGNSGKGTVFGVKTDGTGFTTLHNFSALSDSLTPTNSDGARPDAGLVLSHYNLYGATTLGGSLGSGTVFSISFAPRMTIVPSGANVVMSWPSNFVGFDYTGFILQSAPSIAGTFTNIAGATTPYTNTITGSQRYFRLISN